MTTTEARAEAEQDDPTERQALEWMLIAFANDDHRTKKQKAAQKDAKDKLRAWMEEHSEDEFYDPETGVRAKLGPAPRPLRLDPEVELAPEIIVSAYKNGYLVLNSTLWKARDTTVAPTLQSAAFTKALREGEGTRPLSVEGKGS